MSKSLLRQQTGWVCWGSPTINILGRLVKKVWQWHYIDCMSKSEIVINYSCCYFCWEGLKCVSRFTFQKPKMRSSHNFAFRASQRHYTLPTWSIVSPRNERQNYSRFEMKGRISWFVRSVKMVSACNKSLNIKTLSVNCDHRSKPMFRPTSCLVLRGCTRVWTTELLFAPRSCAAPKHKAHTSPCPHELGQTLAADSRLADPRMAISRNILAHPQNPVRHPGD